MLERFTVRILSNYGDGKVREIVTETNKTLRQVLEPSEIVSEDDYLIKANGTSIGLDYVLKPGDSIVIVPCRVQAAAPVPKLNRFKKFLRANGYVQLPGTATDHENWQSPTGKSLKVNAANHNRAEVDLATFKACAVLEGINIHTLHQRI